MGLTLTAAPGVEPLTRAEAKLHGRIDLTDDDALIDALIVTARRLAEQATGRVLLTQSWAYTLDVFPAAAIEVPLPPLISVELVKYIDSDGVLQTLPSNQYVVHTSATLGKIVPAYACSWPSPRAVLDAVTVAFTAGYGAAAAVPQDIKQWMLLQVAFWYDNRAAASGSKLEPTPYVDALLDPYRIIRF